MSNGEFETVEEIKARMAQESSTKTSQEEVKKEAKEEIQQPVKKLPLSERLDNAYQKLNDTERQAWAEGWRPEEFFGGKNKDGTQRQFIGAEEFLKRREKVLPIANDRLREMAKELEETKKLAREAQERIAKAEQKGYQKALEELERKQTEAVESGDVEEFTKLKSAEKDLINSQFNSTKQEVVEEALDKQDTQSPDPQQQNQSLLSEHDQRVLQDWAAKNNWMRTDEKLAGYAIAAEKTLLRDRPYLSLQERLDIVEQEVKDVFHNKFNKSSSPRMFESGGDAGFGESQRSKSYSDLSPEAKKNCEDLIKIRGIQGEDNIKRFKSEFAKHIN